MNQIIEKTKTICLAKYHLSLKEATSWQLHNALSEAVMEVIAKQWTSDQDKQAHGRRACYLSAEYLIGRAIYNNLYSLAPDDHYAKNGISFQKYLAGQIDRAGLAAEITEYWATAEVGAH